MCCCGSLSGALFLFSGPDLLHGDFFDITRSEEEDALRVVRLEEPFRKEVGHDGDRFLPVLAGVVIGAVCLEVDVLAMKVLRVRAEEHAVLLSPDLSDEPVKQGDLLVRKFWSVAVRPVTRA